MNNKKKKYIEELLALQNEHQAMMRDITAGASKEEEELINKLREEENNSMKANFGERISDSITRFGGSWKFVFIFFFLLFSWMSYNKYLGTEAFDKYPFILLNLILSCLAAIQAPIILMSQNRKETRDRARANDDYLINLKAELGNRLTNKKLDLLINKQFKELIDIQELQIKRIDQLKTIIQKNSPAKPKNSSNLENTL